jgi:stage IV sporulation protein FB
VLVEPERTSYDLRFHLLRFPVRVHPLFWVGSALLGANILELGVEYLLIWIAVVFVSILIHELGHALAFRLFGTDSEIVLYIFGGLAVPWSAVTGRFRRIIVALAGPFAGFVLYGLLYGSNAAFAWAADANGDAANGRPVWFLYRQLTFVNLYWGILNLLPVFPLDGGQVSREVCGKIWRSRGKRISLKISVGVATAIAAYALLCVLDARGGAAVLAQLPGWFPRGTLWTAILFGMLAVQSYQLLQQPDWTEDHWDDRPPWQR